MSESLLFWSILLVRMGLNKVDEGKMRVIREWFSHMWRQLNTYHYEPIVKMGLLKLLEISFTIFILFNIYNFDWFD